MRLRRAIPVLCFALLLLVLAGPAQASHNGRPVIDHYIQSDGTGELIANPSGHPVTWTRCLPGQATCEAYDDGDGEANFLIVRDAAPGTSFEATQDGVTVRSRTWLGAVRATAPPRVRGTIRVGRRVQPLPATWAGGWGREADRLQLQACRTTGGGGCRVIYDRIKYGSCGHGDGRVLPARYRGWWLRVADQRIDREQPFTAEGYAKPEGIKPLKAAPAIAAATVGRIAGGKPRGNGCR
jgi:hypothetical protein